MQIYDHIGDWMLIIVDWAFEARLGLGVVGRRRESIG